MFAIEARYYLGLYQGATAQGEPEPYPTPARLFSALTAGAFSLERLEADEGNADGETAFSNQLDTELFEWLEANPPDAICYPDALLAQSPATAYRNKGEIKDCLPASNKACPASTSSSLGGSITWYWKSEPREAALRRLADIALEVPYLGEAVCPVFLSVTKPDEIPVGALEKRSPSFAAHETSIALPGRSKALQRTYLSNRKPVRKDKAKNSEEENPLEVATNCLGSAYYVAPCETPADPHAAWRWGYMLHTGRTLPFVEWSSWAVCLHRAIVKRLGDVLPSIMQRSRGKDRASANGVAIQFVDPSMPVRDKEGMSGTSLVVMIPAGAPAGEEQLVVRALSEVTRLYSRELGSVDVAFVGERIDLMRFWVPPSAGVRRLFETTPMFIPDSRPPRKRKGNGRKWTVDDDARIAIGHVWRSLFPTTLSGDAGRLELSAAVEKAGVLAFGGRVVPTSDIRSYFHRANSGSMMVGARSFIDLGALGCDECLSAIGQSRHMGGGLLVPFDVPKSMLESLKEEGGETR